MAASIQFYKTHPEYAIAGNYKKPGLSYLCLFRQAREFFQLTSLILSHQYTALAGIFCTGQINYNVNISPIIEDIIKGELDLGPWQQIYYAEFDSQKRKRVIVKIMGA